MDLNIYNVLSAHIPDDALPLVRKTLAERFDFLPVDSGKSAAADIRFVPLDQAAAQRMLPFRKLLEPYYIVMHDRKPCVIQYRRGRPAAMIELGRPLTIHVAERQASVRHINGAFILALHFAARRKGGAIVKGAAAAKDGTCILLAGPPAAAKTTFLVTLLKNGWGFVGNDHILAHGMYLHSLEKHVVYNDFHAAQFPGLFGTQNGSLLMVRLRRVLRWGAMTAERRIPMSFTRDSFLNRLYAPQRRAAPETLVPGCRRINKARATHCMILRPTPDLKLEQCPPDKGLGMLAHLIQGNYRTVTRIAHLAQVLAEMNGLNIPPLHDALGDVAFHTLGSGLGMAPETRLERFLEVSRDICKTSGKNE